jgi:hypothetical protein
MNAYRKLTMIALVTTAMALLAPNARAQMPLEKVKVTVSEPVEVPGLVLPSGTYVFEALENGSLTRILSADENHIYTTLSTVPDGRREPMDTATVILKEGPEGEVERIESWFAPNEPIGNEFVYSKTPSVSVQSPAVGAISKEIVHVTEETIKHVVTTPEYLAVHAEHAIVKSSVATGRFFGARFLVA